MKILITGASGFIGRHLANKLGASLVLTDKVPHNDSVEKVDITIYQEIRDIVKNTKPDVIINLAAECGIINCEEHKSLCYQTNIIGTQNVVDVCMEFGVKLMHFSTSEVYGEYSHQSEDEPIVSTWPKNVYAQSKLFSESIVSQLYDHVIIRPFMVYGPGERFSRYRSAIRQFCTNAKTEGPIIVHKGSQRSWCHINDFCDAISRLVHERGIFNVGHDKEMLSMYDLATKIIDITNEPDPLLIRNRYYNTEIIEIEADHIRTLNKTGNFDKLYALGWTPKVSLDYGIKQLLHD